MQSISAESSRGGFIEFGRVSFGLQKLKLKDAIIDSFAHIGSNVNCIQYLSMPTSLRTQITNSLRSRLLANEWSSGTRLKEEELAREFGVSRGPIRDVFLELTKEGYLRFLPNRGASVSGFPSAHSRPIYLRTRRELEGLALSSGFPNWTESDFIDLEKILRLFRVAAEANDLPEVIQQDMAFHRFLIDHYTEEDLSIVWLPLMTTLALPYSRHLKLMESYDEHDRIFEALKSKDLKGALTLLKSHIQ